MHCQNCGVVLLESAAVCPRCHLPTRARPVTRPPTAAPPTSPAEMAGEVFFHPAQQKSRVAAGLLGIFLGSVGIHRFYLGYPGLGVLQIVVTLITCGAGALWGFIEGIVILAGGIRHDAYGVPLRD
jgi:TM2 domain-containing membrane protein YozV